MQVLYRFRSAATAAAPSAATSGRSARSLLLPGSVTGTTSYLAVRVGETSQIGPFVPFLVAFGVIGLVMSVLIVANVVSGAVVSGYRRIGILKSIGFTPGQVISAYAGQVAIPAVTGCVLGVVLGNLLALPLLAKTANAFGVGSLSVTPWVDVAVPVGMLAVVGIAALLPSLRAGFLLERAVQAIALGRAPAAGRGYAAHRLLARLRLPRPVSIGLAAPFARPARTAITLASCAAGRDRGHLRRGAEQLAHRRGERAIPLARPAGSGQPRLAELLQPDRRTAAGGRDRAARPAGDGALHGRDRSGDHRVRAAPGRFR